MTFVLSRCGEKSIWLMADTRLTASNGGSFRDDGVKLLSLEVTDANALIGYAGLGSTAAGTQPSEWMTRVLTGLKQTLIQSLDTIARAMTEQFPQHSGAIPSRAILNHQVIVVSFAKKRARRFIIRLTPNADGSGSAFRWTEILSVEEQPFLATGSFRALPMEVNDQWAIAKGWAEAESARLDDLVRQAEEEKLPYHEVAQEFAKFNYRVHCADTTVGPNCTVVWRYRDGGGYHQGFEGTMRGGVARVESICQGMNILQISEILGEYIEPQMLEMMRNGFNTTPFPEAEVNRRIAKLPNTPDEKLK